MAHLDSSMSVGERIAAYRVYRGMTQEACAGLAGKSLSWWKKVEQGVRHVEKLSDLITIAQVLHIKNLADLTGVHEVALALDHKREHRLLPAVRRAVFAVHDPNRSPDPLPAPATVRRELDQAWQVWHNAPHFYTLVGEILPDLLTSAAGLYQRAEPDQERELGALLTEVYFLVRHWLVKVNAHDLSWLAADRAMGMARSLDDPLLTAMASWNLIGLMNAMGRAEEALEAGMMGANLLEPMLVDGPDEYLSMWGALQLQGAVAAARCSDPGTAWRLWDAGDEAARRLGVAHVHKWTVFSQPNVGAYAVAVPVELGKSSEALSAADRFDAMRLPSVERRARSLIDVARGYAGRRDDVAAVHVLQQAERESPEELAYSLVTHEVVREMLRRDRKTVSHELRELACRVGIIH